MSLKLRARKDKINKNGLVPVSIQYTHDGISYLYPTGVSALPKLIDDRPSDRNTFIKKCDGYSSMNKAIKMKWKELDDILTVLGGKPSVAELRSYINQSRQNETKQKVKTLVDSFNEYLTSPRIYGKSFENWRKGTLVQYQSVFNSIKELDPKKSILLKDFSLEWVRATLEPHLRSKGQKTSTINKGLKNLKAFLKASYEQGFLDHNIAGRIKLISMSDEEQDQFEEPYVINVKQASRLLNLPLNKKLDNARNLFLILFWTGQRYSDLEQLLANRGSQVSFSIKQTKRSGQGKHGIAEIPVSDTLKELWTRDNHHLSGQKLNLFIKEVIDVYNDTFDDMLIDKNKTTCHTARRSLLTMLYDNGTTRNEIMKISGHRKESTLLVYINREESSNVSESVATLNRLQNLTA